MDRNRNRGRDWPDLVGRRDVQIGPRGRLGNEFARDIAVCWVTRHWPAPGLDDTRLGDSTYFLQRLLRGI